MIAPPPYPQLKTPMPTQAGYLNWIRTVMGVPVAWLPDDNIWIEWTFNWSVATCNPIFACVPGPIYLIAVYNLAGHLLATWAQDPNPWPGSPPAPYVTVDGVQYGFFAWLRKSNNILGFTTGTVSASSDEGTSVSLVVPKGFENLTIAQLALSTTPWGRTYLGIAQDWNQPWGLT